MIFGPVYTEDDVDIHFENWLFDNLEFTYLANLIHVKQQTLDPLVIKNWIFSNIIGGHILVEPLTISSSSVYAQLYMYNVSIFENDFKDSTFVVLKEHSKLVVEIWDFYK